MIKQSLILLAAAAALCSALGDGRSYHSKKSSIKAPSQYASVASFHSSKPAVPETERIQEPKPQAARPVALSPYAFGYQAEGSARQESADASGKVTGSYQVVNEDGSVRLVKYVADENGFRADIDTNEPGTKSDNPADVTLKSAAVEKKYEAPAKKYGAAHDFAQKATMYQQKPAMFSAPLQGQSNYGQSSSFQQQQQVRQYSVPAMQRAPIQQASQFSDASKPSPYAFSYDAQLEDGSSSRSESADASGKVTGQYSLATADGRKRIVKYEADHEGFRASVDSNEFGADSPARMQYPSAAPVAPQMNSAPLQTTSNAYGAQQRFSGVKTFQAPVMSYQGQSSIQYNAPAYEKPSPYAFNYAADLEDGTMSRSESADESGKVVGSYSLYVADGRQRKVDYVATPEEGFRATVTTNEFGTDPKAESPADVQFYSSATMDEPKPYSSPNAYRPQTRAAAATASMYSQSAIAQQPIQFNMGADNAGYSYNYQTSLEDGGRSSQSESADGSGKVTGYYSMSIPDGRQRKVDYTADAAGFQASIDTNEFGTKSDSPAHVSFLSSAPQLAPEAPRQAAAFKAPSAPQFNAPQTASAGMYQTSFGTDNRVERVQSFQPSPYSFNYQAEASGGSSSRQESADANGAVTGSYEVRNEDGSVRVVEYIADKDGFRANVKTNEVGTKSDNPADVIVKSDAPAFSSLPLQQQRPAHMASSQFPAPTYTAKTSMVTQQKVDAWSR